MLSYIFALCSPDKRFPDHREWYLRIDQDRQVQISEVSERVRSAIELKYGFDRHYFNQSTGEPKSDFSMLFHPTYLTGQWLITAVELFSKYNLLYVGISGQMFSPDPDKFIEHSTQSLPKLQFPSVIPNETIYVSKWKDGVHYYLQSTIGRLFSKDKFSTKAEALEEAMLYVDRSRIHSDENRIGKKYYYQKEGD